SGMRTGASGSATPSSTTVPSSSASPITSYPAAMVAAVISGLSVMLAPSGLDLAHCDGTGPSNPRENHSYRMPELSHYSDSDHNLSGTGSQLVHRVDLHFLSENPFRRRREDRSQKQRRVLATNYATYSTNTGETH